MYISGWFPANIAYRTEQARDLQLSVDEPNFYIAPSLAMLAGDPENLNEEP